MEKKTVYCSRITSAGLDGVKCIACIPELTLRSINPPKDKFHTEDNFHKILHAKFITILNHTFGIGIAFKTKHCLIHLLFSNNKAIYHFTLKPYSFQTKKR